MRIELNKATVTLLKSKSGCDTVFIKFKANPPMPKVSSQEPIAQINVAQNYGLDWIKENLNVDEKNVIIIESN